MVARRAVILALREAGYAGFADLVESDDVPPAAATYAFRQFSCD
jgi:hypothetical protein